MDGYFRIGDFARIGGVSVKTLRFYDSIGLFRPAGVDPRTRYRLYSAPQLRDLARILALRGLGASLPEIRQAIGGDASRPKGRRLLEALRKAKLDSIDEARKSLSWIEAALHDLDAFASPVGIIVKRSPPVRVASIRVGVPRYQDIYPYESDLLEAVPKGSAGYLRGILWHRCADSGEIEGEPFVEVRRDVPVRSGFEVKQLPAVTVACAFSSLNDADAESAYDTLGSFVRSRNCRLVGARREIYRDQMLEIQYPLESC
jgi:DNA-binding transcriptional MerR regulator/effector-binding domain-containing protein